MSLLLGTTRLTDANALVDVVETKRASSAKYKKI